MKEPLRQSGWGKLEVTLRILAWATRWTEISVTESEKTGKGCGLGEAMRVNKLVWNGISLRRPWDIQGRCCWVSSWRTWKSLGWRHKYGNCRSYMIELIRLLKRALHRKIRVQVRVLCLGNRNLPGWWRRGKERDGWKTTEWPVVGAEKKCIWRSWE